MYCSSIGEMNHKKKSNYFKNYFSICLMFFILRFTLSTLECKTYEYILVLEQ